jgi:parallel beta-helix repeat protein/predicted outer membrane repeat protein
MQFYEENITITSEMVAIADDDPQKEEKIKGIIDATIIDGTHTKSAVIFQADYDDDDIFGGNKNVTFQGMTITNGYGYDDEWGYDGGGGILCVYSSPTIRYCTITQNEAKWDGGGIYLWISSPGISHCIISNNEAKGYWGGGILCALASTPHISDCRITHNNAPIGGGVYCHLAYPTFYHCTITGNIATDGGGGIYCRECSHVIIADSTISDNHAETGAGLYFKDSEHKSTVAFYDESLQENKYGCEYIYDTYSPCVIGCTISANTAVGTGGGISCKNSLPAFINAVVSRNSAFDGGGIYCADHSASFFSQCTIANNNTGGLYCESSFPRVINSIVWDNTSYEIAGDMPVVSYSDVQGDYTGTGNIDADPFFVDPTGGDYHLQFGSPCIDVGTNTSVPSQDKDGIPRPLDGDNSGEAVCDMGAYEYSCVGDFDGDGDVDDSDLTIFAADFGHTDCGGDCEGDFNDDGDVDGSDLAIFANDFGRTDCPCDAPECQ